MLNLSRKQWKNLYSKHRATPYKLRDTNSIFEEVYVNGITPDEYFPITTKYFQYQCNTGDAEISDKLKKFFELQDICFDISKTELTNVH